ncbi:putative ribosome biogenesis GTPase RsgA [Spirochaetia bacterium]|nr:putative ribosome biogenesis GTPase RsgA [Spirochaetia bacterium]
MRGMVIRSSWNVFTVRVNSNTVGIDTGEIECRIKGKILKGAEGYYNPLAPGDWVTIEADPDHAGTGMILDFEERRNVFTRKNPKGLGAVHSTASQILAANADLVLCVTTPASPPFRPRFLDRVLLQADAAGIPSVILCNKYDLIDEASEALDVEERLEDFRRIGYTALCVSAKTGEGIAELRRLIQGRFSVLVGQSGVGKSSIVNALIPDLNIRVGVINEKYDRGNHTTTQASMVEISGDTFLIDTPGIRRFVPDGVGPADLIFHMREFAPLAGKCTYGLSCSHRTEPGCKIMEAVDAGVIHEDRYESFLRIQDELLGKKYAD